MPDRMPEIMSEQMPDRMPEKMSDRMSEYMPEGMSARMSEYVSYAIYIYIFCPDGYVRRVCQV